MKILIPLLLLLTSAFAQTAKCSFTRHQHVSVEGVPDELKKKILNEFEPDKLYIQKENKELNIKICTTIDAYKDAKTLAADAAKIPGEHLQTKVMLKAENQFWSLKLETLKYVPEKKETISFIESGPFKSPKTVDDIKNAEVAAWVYANLISNGVK